MKKTLLTFVSCLSISIALHSQNFVKSTINGSTSANPYTIASGYLDGDSYLDIAIGTDGGHEVEWYKNNGNGTFATGITLIATAPNNLINVEGITIADINGDSFNDIIATSYGKDNVVWFENNGDSTFQPAVTIANGLDGAGAVMLANLDNDPNGYLDIIVSAFGPDGDTDSVVYMIGNGDGTFGAIQYVVPETAGAGPGTLDLADYDNDGDLDVLVGFTGNGDIYIYDNRVVPDGTLSFVQYSKPVNTGNVYLTSAVFADLNDDGNLDIIKSDYNHLAADKAIVWYSNESAGTGTTFSAHPITTSISKTSIGAVADFNNDTYNDLIILNGRSTDNDIAWFKSDSSGGLGAEIFIDDSHASIFDIEIQDFDNDGDLDFVTVSYFQNDVNLFLNDLELGVDEESTNLITVYPNPTDNVLNFKGFNEDFTVATFDTLGRRVLNSTLTLNQSLDVSKLNSGIYILKFEGTNSTFKFIKK